MIVITVPLLYPVLLKYGIDPVWFGIIVVLFIEIGQITPPIGINLFVIQSISHGKLSDVVMGTIPFHLLMFVLLIAGGLARDRAVAAQSHECASMTDRHALYPTGLKDAPTRHRALRRRMEAPRHRRGTRRLRLHHRAAGRGRGL